MIHNLIECFGIKHDLKTITNHKNRKGKEFLERIIMKALNNVRANVRAALGRATTMLKDQGTKGVEKRVS
jgi:hypothetical protein